MGDVSGYDNVVVVAHPLVQHKLSLLRDADTGPKVFRELVRELAVLLAYEATRGFSLEETVVTTPLTEARTRVLAGRKVAVFPILRAGLGMVEGVLELLPAAKVGHVGLYRDHESLQPVEYYFNTPDDLAERDVMVVDPMLATGGSAAAACEFLRARGAGAISLLVLIAAPEGIERVTSTCQAVTIFAGAVDSHLDERGYIVPGLGDAGDRLYGTS
jgi:uracil phosphoribosyltransferase